MNDEHKSQCNHIDHTIVEQVAGLATKIDTVVKSHKANSEKLDYNNKITEGLVQQISGMSSDIKVLDNKVNANHLEMKPWLEAKIGLNLLWRWGVSIPVIIGVLIGFKTLLGWMGFHK